MTKSLDRLLREALRERTAPNLSGPCLDAETVAGWFDGTLGARDRAAAEAHAADCARCQALLAAMVRTDPPALSQPWRRPAFIAWLVPLSVAVAALLVWVNLPERPGARPPVNTPGDVKLDDGTERRTEAYRSDEARVPPTTGRNDLASGKKEKQREERSERAARSRDAVAQHAGSGARAAPEPPPPPPPPSAAAPAPSPESVAETITVGRPQPAVARMSSAPRNALIVSLDSVTRWRIAADGAVQRSTDGGLTWQTQATGADVTLTAGASPSSTVCWLVGPGGVVLVTTDGRSWERLAFPEVVDLVSIRASDDRTATVTTIDGRRFTTADRGQSWER
jgi:hypothetical protein